LSINQSNWQHREKTKGAIKNGQTRATGNIERKPKGQSKMEVCPFFIAPFVFSLFCQLLWLVHF
jgi:hypothetical protein